MHMQIGLLKADYVNDDLIPLHGDLGEMFHRFLSGVMAVDLTVYEIRHGEYPASLDVHDAYVISGSRFSVNDKDPWVSRLMDFIRAAGDSVPVIGFCFGHQAIARSLGGCVEPRSVPNVGARRIEMQSYPVWAPRENEIPQALFNHGEQVTGVPEGGPSLREMPSARPRSFSLALGFWVSRRILNTRLPIKMPSCC